MWHSLTKVFNIPKAWHIFFHNLSTWLTDCNNILNFKFEDDDKQGIIKIALKYNQSTKVPAITKIQRASRPGLRKYNGSNSMPRVLNGLGVAIVSTSKGVITGKQAKKMNVGGEVLCYVY